MRGMRVPSDSAVSVLILSALCGCTARSEVAAVSAPIEFAGSFSFPGDAHDRSGLSGALEDGTPCDRLGGFGSAIAWTGKGTRYVAACDRGPADGTTSFQDRLEFLEIGVSGGHCKAELAESLMLVNEDGKSFVGDARAFDAQEPQRGLRLDPEGIRVGRDGHYYLSDEYGPWILEFDPRGHCLRRLPVPERFRIEHPGPAAEERMPENTRGRVTNKGFEGLAISPDGGRLFALLQAPLIQDHGKKGRLCRMLELTLSTGHVREFVVSLEREGLSFTELLAIDGQRFLALERDSGSGGKSGVKRVLELDIRGASEVGTIDSLPAGDPPQGVICVSRHTFLDLLEPALGLDKDSMPEKVEGLAFGPDLPDGRHLLLVTSDNDFRSEAPSWIWAFAIAPAALPGLEPQRFDPAR